MRVMPSVYYRWAGHTTAPARGCEQGPGRALGSAGAGAARLVGPLGLEVRDGLLDLGLVLGLPGLLDHLGGDPGRDELLDHSHVRLLVVGCSSSARTNGRPTTSPPTHPTARAGAVSATSMSDVRLAPPGVGRRRARPSP